MTQPMRAPRSAVVSALLKNHLKTAAFALVAGAQAGCSNSVPGLEPQIIAPPPGSAAYPYSGADVLLLSIARAGDDLALQEAAIAIGDELVLPETPFADDLVVHLSALSAGVEIAYGRTCAVDVRPAGNLPAPMLYLSRIVRWGPGGQPVDGRRVGGAAYALPGSGALFAGGTSGSIERYDAVTGTYAALTDAVTPRQPVTLAPFGDGRAIVVGGLGAGGEPVDVVEVIDPDLPGGLQVTRIPGPAVTDHAMLTLVDGTVLVAGGRTRASAGAPLLASRDAWLLRFGDGDVLEPPALLGAAMNASRAGHTMTRLGDEVGADVLIVGGRDDAGAPVALAELYRPLRQAFEPLLGALLLVPRWGHAAVRLPGGFVLILGGYTAAAGGAGEPVYELELYDPHQGRFSPAGTLPQGAGLSSQSITPLPDGRVLIAGGLNAAGSAVATAYIARFDPVDGQVDVVATDSLAYPRAGHSAVRLCDGTILVVGGTSDPEATQAERYNPPSLGRR